MADQHQYRVLLIEDDYDVAEMLILFFQAQGYHVEHADTGTSGIDKARKFFPHVILLDVMLPDMDGYDTCIGLRQKALTRYIPILFLTQRDERAAKVKGLELGADDYITKPFDVDELRLRVQAVIRRATRENLHETRTGLPTSSLVISELERRKGTDFYEMHFRLNNFSSYSDVYSFMAANDVLYHAGKTIQDVVADLGTHDDFVGIVEDDFIVLSNADDVDAIEEVIQNRFSEEVKAFYSFADVERGGILLKPDSDEEEFVPFMQIGRVEIATK